MISLFSCIMSSYYFRLGSINVIDNLKLSYCYYLKSVACRVLSVHKEIMLIFLTFMEMHYGDDLQHYSLINLRVIYDKS